MVSCKNNAATTDSLFSTYYVLNKIIFDYLKVYHQISLKPKVEQMLILLTSDIPLYNLPHLDVKIPNRPLNRPKLDKDFGLIYFEPGETLTYMLEIQEAKF